MKQWKTESEPSGADAVSRWKTESEPSGADAVSQRKTETSRVGAACDEEFRKARDKGLYYLQFSGKTESEMRKKLAEQGFSPASVDSAVTFLKSYRYLDDGDYARRYLERNRRKKSGKQIRYELQQKGVSRELLDEVFEDMPVDEEAQIRELLKKRKFSGTDADREERQRQAAYFARKGFSYEAIRRAMDRFREED